MFLNLLKQINKIKYKYCITKVQCILPANAKFDVIGN